MCSSAACVEFSHHAIMLCSEWEPNTIGLKVCILHPHPSLVGFKVCIPNTTLPVVLAVLCWWCCCVAVQTNSEPFVLYQLGKLTTDWLINQGQHVLVPAFNGYQVSKCINMV